MAIKKKIKKTNGIELDYHRIVMIKMDVGQNVTVLVHSYLNEESRQYEKEYAAGKISKFEFPYVDAEYLSLDYNEDISIKNVYKLLKKIDKFSGGEDV